MGTQATLVTRAALIASRLRREKRGNGSETSELNALRVAVAIEESPDCEQLSEIDKRELRNLMRNESLPLWDPNWDKTFVMAVLLKELGVRLEQQYEICCPTHILRRILGDKSLLMAQLSLSRGHVGFHLICQALYNYAGLSIDEPEKRIPEYFYRRAIPYGVDEKGRGDGCNISASEVRQLKKKIFADVLNQNLYGSGVDYRVSWPKSTPEPLIMGLTRLELCSLAFDVSRLTQAIKRRCIGRRATNEKAAPKEASRLYDTLIMDGYETAQVKASDLQGEQALEVEEVFSGFCRDLDKIARELRTRSNL